MSLVFLFKTSRVRTPETSEDYGKLSSGDVACEGGVGVMRALHNPVPKKLGKVSYGVLRSFEDTLHIIKGSF